MARIATLARVTPEQVYAASLAQFDHVAVDFTGLGPSRRESVRQIAARGWAPLHGTQICPGCLDDTGTWQAAWRLPIVTTCTTHRTFLPATCPACQRPFRDQHHSHLRRGGAALLCGNPLGQGPTRQCRHDLTTVPAQPAPGDVLAMQRRVDTALAGEHVTVLGATARPSAYLSDLRHTATLLLHLAGQPGADELADWVHRLRVEARSRTRDRGPRWGIRAPDDPALRGAALATADTILSVGDLDDAVAMLIPWVQLTPRTPDGPLGWLADHTVMTPTLTRLVMAARTPHRRMSHHLDTQQGPGATMQIDTRGVPQVVPADLYQAHLADSSTSGEQTVRTFAALCLARLDPAVTSWAKAAAALAMPATMGVNTARACSAKLLLDHDDWTMRLQAVWDGLRVRGTGRGRWNYRTLERRVAHRRYMSRWFDEWARACRPATRYESRLHALTWQWVHVAHAHLDLSPAWDGQRPTAQQRAGYRQFEASLGDAQQRELRYALHKRAGGPGPAL